MPLLHLHLGGGDINESYNNGNPVNIGPGMLMTLPEKGEVGFASPNAPIQVSLEVVDKLLKWAAVCNGLPAASLSTDPTEESGVSKLVGNAELEEARRDSIALFAKVEQQLFNLWKTIWNVHNPGRQISEAATLTCDFYDPKPSVSGYEQARQMETFIDLGLISRVDALIELNPDLSREEAKARLKEIALENQEFRPAEPDYAQDAWSRINAMEENILPANPA